MRTRNYDYIVVGSGSSGSALASVLATKGSTLLIERGANHTSFPQSMYRQGWPQISVLALDRLQIEGSGHWTGTANVLGGGSALNAAVCWRGERKIFEELGFDLEKVEEKFKFLEDRICYETENTEVSQAVVDAWESLGFPFVNTSSGLASWAETRLPHPFVQRSRSILPPTQKRMPASSLYEHAFSDQESSILDAGNLTVYLLTKAKRVLFSDAKEAVGVEVISPAGEFSVYVRKSGMIFLCAGVFETPKLLMLSGIGPRGTLNNFGIKVIHENEEVGRNLIDRKEVNVAFPLSRPINGDDIEMLDIAAIGDSYWASVFHKHSIPWGNALQGCSTCAPISRTKSCFEQMFGALMSYGSGMESIGLPVYVSQRYPRTRGHISLSSSDYNDPPRVFDGWTTDFDLLSSDAKYDLDILKTGMIDLVLNAMNNTTLLESFGFPSRSSGIFPLEFLSSDINGSYFDTTKNVFDSCTFSETYLSSNKCLSWDTCFPSFPTLSKNDTELEKSLFELLSSSQHASSTCKVGYVVDKKTLAVRGVQGLYIADLSVVASPIDIHPMMTAMTIGLVLGDSIKSIPIEEYDEFPVTLSIIFIAFVGCLLMFWLKIKSSKTEDIEEEESEKRPNGMSRASIRDIFTSMKAVPQQRARDLVALNTDKPLEGNLLEDNDEVIETTCLMSWSDVSCTYESGRGDNKKSVTTLFNNFGSMNEGEVTAIMGPSGAAKSTLLDILSGRKSLGKVEGSFSLFGSLHNISVDGLEKLGAQIQASSVYIPQQEYFYPTQTCEEAILFQVNMKFGRGDMKERRKFMSACLSIVGLPPLKFASRIIGGELAGGITIRGLSGGERKRLALACTLALKPKMMFIDELTSGLDSENSYLIMKLLKDLSIRKRVASMIIIHQPDPETFALFDNLILLSKGRCVFSGNVDTLDSFYEVNYDESMPSSGYLAGDLIKKASSYDGMDGEDFFRGKMVDLVSMTNTASTQKAPGLLWKLYTVFQRNLTNQYVRNVTNVASRYISYVGLGSVIGAIFWRVGKPEGDSEISFDDASLIIGSSIFVLNVAYLLPFATIPVFVSDKKFLAAESSLGLYHSWMYGVSQLFLEFVFLSFTMTSVTIVTFYMCGMANATMPVWSSFLTVLSVLIMSGLVGSSMVLMTTVWLPSQDLAFLASSTLVTISLALSGAFLPFSDMPNLPYSLQWISPVKYSLQGMLSAQMTGTGAEMILYIGELNTPSTVSENIAVLCGFFIIISFVTAIGMAHVREVR